MRRQREKETSIIRPPVRNVRRKFEMTVRKEPDAIAATQSLRVLRLLKFD